MISGVSGGVVCTNYFSAEAEIIQIPSFFYCKWPDFVSTLHVVITIILPSFSVCHFVVFIETEHKKFAWVFVPACFFLNKPLNLVCR